MLSPKKGRPKNVLKSVQMRIAANDPLVEQLEALVATGLFGKNAAEAGERLIAKGLYELRKEGEILRGFNQGDRK